MGFPAREQQRRTWQTSLDTNAFPTVQSLLRAIMEESTRIHSNSDKLRTELQISRHEAGGRRGSGKWHKKARGGKEKGRGRDKWADVPVEPYFKGKCDNCGAHGHKAIRCRQPVRQTWQPGHDVRGGKKDPASDYVKGKKGKKLS
jgi:hypothetical protein